MDQYRALVIGCGGSVQTRYNTACSAADARQFASLLVSEFYFARNEIALLVDHEVTRRNVAAALHWLMSDVSVDCQRILYFSGLGHRVPSAWMLREALALHDGSFLYDNEIAFLSRKLSPASLTVVLDVGFRSSPSHRAAESSRTGGKCWRDAAMPEGAREAPPASTKIAMFKPFGCESAAFSPREDCAPRGVGDTAPNSGGAISTAI